MCADDAIDLLSKMLIYDHADRITPKDAMEHAYFLPLKKKIEKIIYHNKTHSLYKILNIKLIGVKSLF